MKLRLLLLALLTVALLFVGCNGDVAPLPGSGSIVVTIGNKSYREPVDVLYNFREEEGEDILQAHLLRPDEIGFTITMRTPGENSMTPGLFSPDTAVAIFPCDAVMVLDGTRVYDAVGGNARVIAFDLDRNATQFQFDLVMVESDAAEDSLIVTGAVVDALLLRQE